MSERKKKRKKGMLEKTKEREKKKEWKNIWKGKKLMNYHLGNFPLFHDIRQVQDKYRNNIIHIIKGCASKLLSLLLARQAYWRHTVAQRYMVTGDG